MADGSAITLEFDGDPLAPEEVVQNTELSDLDIVNVHIS